MKIAGKICTLELNTCLTALNVANSKAILKDSGSDVKKG
jgi:hypothetical protein